MVTEELLVAGDDSGVHALHGAFGGRAVDRWRGSPSFTGIRAVVGRILRRLVERAERSLVDVGAVSDRVAEGVLAPVRVATSPCVREHERPIERVRESVAGVAVRSACAAQDASAGHAARERLEALGACVRAVGRGDRTSVARVTFANETSVAATVVALESPAFERVEMHGPVRSDGTGTTRRIDAVEILAGDSVTFSPESRPLRLIGPRRTLRSGQIVGLTATFSSGRRRVLPFRVVETL